MTRAHFKYQVVDIVLNGTAAILRHPKIGGQPLEFGRFGLSPPKVPRFPILLCYIGRPRNGSWEGFQFTLARLIAVQSRVNEVTHDI